MGKDAKSLKASMEKRAKVVLKYGIVPTSILKNNLMDRAIDPIASARLVTPGSYQDKTNPNYKHFAISGRGSRWGALSRFPQNIGRILVKFYTNEGQIVYDPHAGHNSRMQLTYECNRHYVGVDICHEFMEMNKFVAKQLKSLTNSSTITLIEGSSDKVDLPDNYADFTLTSPPYWNMEYYGPEPEQLGNAPTYERFLELLYNHIAENYRILKPGAWCCYNINDFRINGVFYPYHVDATILLKKAGFIIQDTIIMDICDTPYGFIFADKIDKQKQFPKRHEYVVIAQK
jgi:DNA modification methylase